MSKLIFMSVTNNGRAPFYAWTQNAFTFSSRTYRRLAQHAVNTMYLNQVIWYASHNYHMEIHIKMSWNLHRVKYSIPVSRIILHIHWEFCTVNY